ncbi:MAG: hypothetical protein IJG13_20040, partial [Kiritimatiellae bacterium]|nr:hypothetical protein [Kiritimatiellia bacterium]
FCRMQLGAEGAIRTAVPASGDCAAWRSRPNCILRAGIMAGTEAAATSCDCSVCNCMDSDIIPP